nr:hypothetical protein [Tanacetum cinerariifolium]
MREESRKAGSFDSKCYKQTGYVWSQTTAGNGETTRCEHYGGGSSNQVALDVAEEKGVGSGGVEMKSLDVTEVKVGCPEKVLNVEVMKSMCGRGSSIVTSVEEF